MWKLQFAGSQNADEYYEKKVIVECVICIKKKKKEKDRHLKNL